MVTHHPLFDSVEISKTAKKFNSTIVGYSFLKTAREYGYNLFIHGHIHEKSCIEIIDRNANKVTPLMQVGVPNIVIDDDKAGAVLIDTENSSEKKQIVNFLKIIDMTKSFKVTETIEHNISTDATEKHESDIILIDREIEKLITDNIIIKNGNIRNVEAASYDCSLGYNYKKGNGKYCNWKEIVVVKFKQILDLDILNLLQMKQY